MPHAPGNAAGLHKWHELVSVEMEDEGQGMADGAMKRG
jgi:hypothetical protein